MKQKGFNNLEIMKQKRTNIIYKKWSKLYVYILKPIEFYIFQKKNFLLLNSEIYKKAYNYWMIARK